MLQKILDFFRQKKWQQMKKSDWIALALTGVLLLILALPTDETDFSENSKGTYETPGTGYETSQAGNYGMQWNGTGSGEKEDYTRYLESHLEEVLGAMNGVGRVKVMITFSDYGESVVEKDSSGVTSTISETDSSGGSRTTTEQENSQTTVYVETGDETYPYIEKEVLPTIKGVVVVAEGGGNPSVVADISGAVMALFPVEAHRIKVVKMSS